MQVYSYSFLHFGLREAAHRTASLVISDALLAVQSERLSRSVSVARQETAVSHPCFATGYVYTPMFSYSGEQFAPIQVKMNGTSDFESCESLVRRIFEKDLPCLIERCSFYGVYQPRVYRVPFLAFAHFADVVSDLGLPPNAQLDDVRIATRGSVLAQDTRTLDHTFSVCDI